jgi:serine/threonine protein kinase
VKLCDGSNENIVTVYNHGLLWPNYFIDMEICMGSLQDFVHDRFLVSGTLRWKTMDKRAQILYMIRNLLRGICKGLKFIHDHDEVHRDISPDNSSSQSVQF